MSQNKENKKSGVTLKETEDQSLYNCDSESLSEYFVKRQIDDYCVSTQGVVPD